MDPPDTRRGVWIFDHARPRRRATAERFPGIFTPVASPTFKADSTNSLIASWSFEELRNAITGTLGSGIESQLARWLRLYQVHWAPGRSRDPAGPWPDEESISDSARADANGLSGLFATLPGETRQ